VFFNWAFVALALFSASLLIMSCKTPEFFEKPPLLGAEKHRQDQVTSYLYVDTTNVDFAYIESE